jgi:aminoglycoside phosphotransferase (APT) family kinase protein
MKRSDKLKAGKFDVDVGLVRRLVDRQFPHWAHLPIAPVDNDGWDNWTFRLGDKLKVRLPSDTGYAEQAEKESKWLPRLAPQLPVAVPEPLALGSPDLGYPWQWSVYQWLEGEPARPDNVADRVQFARDIAGFLAALYRIDPAGGPPPGTHNFLRGAPIMSAYGADARRWVDALAGRIDTAAAHAVLDAAQAAPWRAAPCWLHGDIAVGNLLVRGGRLDAVIDFGCLAVGDPACDLVIAWLFLDGESREAFRAAMPHDPGLWARARAWALWKAALVLATNSPLNPDENSPLSVIAAVIAETAAGP